MHLLFSNYIKKHTNKKQLLEQLPYCPLTVIIPCYDEEAYISKTLESLWKNTRYDKSVHIIIVLNQHAETSESVCIANKRTEQNLHKFKESNSRKNFLLSIINITFPKTSMGVGSARKVGMDEAIRQYAYHNKDGVLVSLDADTLCAKNYLSEIIKIYIDKPLINSTVVNYQHRFENYPQEQRKAIALYEIYLRYMTLSYRYIGHPNAFHTIGSAFTVKASVYCKQGGMNHRQAGEDFYFLQKIFNYGNCKELNTSCVFPSGRFSDRVPFGTGKSIESIIQDTNGEFYTYNFEAFQELKEVIDTHPLFFKQTIKTCKRIASVKFSKNTEKWLTQNNFFENLEEMNNNSASLAVFSKKFFTRFSILQIIKFLNASHLTVFKQINIIDSIKQTPYAKYCDFTDYATLLHSIRIYYVKQKKGIE